MPSLEKLHQEFQQKSFTLLAIDIKEKPATVLQSVRSHGLSYTNLVDEDGSVSVQYGVSSTPIKFIIDKDGYMVGAALGFREWDKQEIRELMHLLMESSTS